MRERYANQAADAGTMKYCCRFLVLLPYLFRAASAACDYPYRCDGRATVDSFLKSQPSDSSRQASLCNGNVAGGKLVDDGGNGAAGQGGMTNTCCSAFELSFLCKYVETDLMIDERFEGDVVFKDLIAIHGRKDADFERGSLLVVGRSGGGYMAPTPAYSLVFPELERVNHNIIVEHNLNLESLHFPKLTWITGTTFSEHTADMSSSTPPQRTEFSNNPQLYYLMLPSFIHSSPLGHSAEMKQKGLPAVLVSHNPKLLKLAVRLDVEIHLEACPLVRMVTDNSHLSALIELPFWVYYWLAPLSTLLFQHHSEQLYSSDSSGSLSLQRPTASSSSFFAKTYSDMAGMVSHDYDTSPFLIHMDDNSSLQRAKSGPHSLIGQRMSLNLAAKENGWGQEVEIIDRDDDKGIEAWLDELGTRYLPIFDEMKAK